MRTPLRSDSADAFSATEVQMLNRMKQMESAYGPEHTGDGVARKVVAMFVVAVGALTFGGAWWLYDQRNTKPETTPTAPSLAMFTTGTVLPPPRLPPPTNDGSDPKYSVVSNQPL